MSPIDDELRAALTARAGQLHPSPDPLAGIERRARRILRHRVAASVAATALAVSGIALAVPALAPGTTSDRVPPSVATQPAPVPSPSYRPANALDWRRDLPLDDDRLDRDVSSAWAGDHGVAADQVQGELLLSTLLPQCCATVAVYQLWVDQEPAFSVVVQRAEDAPLVVVRDTESTPDVPYVDGVVSVVDPYVVVAVAPTVTSLEYAGDGESYEPVPLSDGGGLVLRTLDEGPAPDRLRISDRQAETFDADVYGGPTDGDPGTSDFEPDNLLDWPTRGTVPNGLLPEAERAFATSLGKSGATVRSTVLFGGDDDAGNAYLLMQAWLEGDDAYTFGYVTGPGRAPEPVLAPKTDPDQRALALLVAAAPGQTRDTLVVVPRPGTGQVLYGETGPGYRPVGQGQDYLDGVVLIGRQPGAEGDRLQLLDGDGGEPFFEGAVSSLLCGLKGCG